MEKWQGFSGETWKNGINVRDFIVANYTPYDGDASFLQKATKRTEKIMDKVNALLKVELEKGVVDFADIYILCEQLF